MKKSYTPPYKFKGPKAPENAYDVVCPYWASPGKNIQWDFEPIRFAKPRLPLQKQIRTGG
jgi:hypothetical protein